jgi:uncharacterized membrane protein
MSEVVPHLKVLHIAMLVLWCGGLFALPTMLARHDPVITQADYTRIRFATHYAYTFVITPAAVLAIVAGTVLIFARDLHVPWLYAKMVCVALLVAFHAWVGHVIHAVADTPDLDPAPDPGLPRIILVVLIVVILTIVLAKPELDALPMPAWLTEPRGNQLPFDVPRR